MRRLRWLSLPPHSNVIDGQASGPKLLENFCTLRMATPKQ